MEYVEGCDTYPITQRIEKMQTGATHMTVPHSTMTPKDKSFNVKITSEHFAKLSELAGQADMSRGQVIRILITRAFAMRCEGIPTCSTGRLCPMPQLHVAAAPPAQREPTEI